ncbi:MAG: aminotransferase class I/II-fold pyridoxal phosphate-dependent enzyme [Pseudomonadota bacterium]
MSNPNNPTRRVKTADTLDRVVHIATRAGAWLIVDEVYAGLEWVGPHAPCVAGLYKKSITTGPVSKALGLQALRIGWLVCQDPGLITDAVILRENSSEIMNIMGELITEVSLGPERLKSALEQARTAGQANLSRLERWIGATDGFTWVRPQAGLIGLGRLPEGIESDAFAQRLLEEPYRTFVMPGSAYGQPRHVRLDVGGGEEVKLEQGVKQLARAFAEWECQR